MSEPTGIVGVIAWSHTRWKGFDREGFERRKDYGFRYVQETGTAHEWWNFYEDFDDRFYFGHIETGGRRPTKFRAGIIIFVSRNINDGKYYFVGFYGKGEYNASGFKTGKKITDLLPGDVKEDLNKRLERKEISENYAEYLKKALTENIEYVTSFRGEKSFSAVFDSEGYVKVVPEDLGVRQFGQWSFSYIGDTETVKPEKIRQLLLMAKQKHEELLQRPDVSEDKKKEIHEIIGKIDSVLNEYFGGEYDKIELKRVLSELKRKYEGEWRNIESEIVEALKDVREIVKQYVQNNRKIDFETAKTVYDKIEAINDKAFLFWIWPYPWGKNKQEEIENIMKKILNNEFCKDALINAENVQLSNLNDFKEKVEDVLGNINGVKIRTLSSWLSVFNPELFIPAWGGVIKSRFQGDFGITIPETAEKFIEFTKMIKEVADELGIDSMIEVAFYLSKYSGADRMSRKFWQMSPGESGEYLEQFVKNRKIYLGWGRIGDLRNFKTEDEIKSAIVEQNYPHRDLNRVVRTLMKFFKEVKVGDIVVLKHGNSKKIYGICKVVGDYEYDPLLEDESYAHARKVKFLKVFSKPVELEELPRNFVQWAFDDLDTERGELILKSLRIVRPEETFRKIDKLLNFKKQIILYGPPGTGKTWIAKNYVRLKTNDNKEFYKFVTFHPSYCYEEFVEGIRPETINGSISYKVKDGIFKEICKEAYNKLLEVAGINKEWNNDLPELGEDEKERVKTVLDSEDYPKFYLVIDEINRGDVSRIFGELITLLEADKRLFAENEIVTILPYSKTKFGVPPNLFIIGTMNTADRSIALIDIALRRRFGFIELMPSYKVLLKELGIDNVESEKEAIEKIESWDRADLNDVNKLAVKVLYSINEKIKEVYGRDHQIGHSYFLKLKECENAIETLKYIWFHEVIPLLQEYFYDSPKKLKEVLSDKFVIVDENETTYEFKQMEDFSDDDFLNALRELAQRGE